MGREISYSDALRILGDYDSKVLLAIDKLLGGVIVGAAAATGHLELLTLLHARDELVEQSKKLLANIGQRVRGARAEAELTCLLQRMLCL